MTGGRAECRFADKPDRRRTRLLSPAVDETAPPVFDLEFVIQANVPKKQMGQFVGDGAELLLWIVVRVEPQGVVDFPSGGLLAGLGR